MLVALVRQREGFRKNHMLSRIKAFILIVALSFCFTAAAWAGLPEGAAALADPGPQQPRRFYLDLNPAESSQEIPPVAQKQPQRRIVDGRPALYQFKRAINPLNWLSRTLEATFVSTESGRLSGLVQRLGGPKKRAGHEIFLGGAGSGSGLGPGLRFFHRNLFGRGVEVEVPLLITYKDYQVFELNTRFPLLNDGRLNLDVRGAYRSRPLDNFFGIGNETAFENRTKFRSVTREVVAGLSSEINEQWSTGLHLAYRNIGVTDPTGVPSAQDVFDRSKVPGLAGGAELASLVFSVENDTKDNRRIPSTGGLRQLEISLNEGIGRGDFSFWRYRADLQQFFSLDSSHRKIIALRALIETNQEKGGSQVPFFEMATLGGANSLRSFQNFRFYDKSAVAFLLEYRYRVWRAFDWALFLEEGQVAPEPGDFAWDRFHTGYGVRFYIRATPALPISFDLGRSRDGWRVYFRFKPSF